MVAQWKERGLVKACKRCIILLYVKLVVSTFKLDTFNNLLTDGDFVRAHLQSARAVTILKLVGEVFLFVSSSI